MDNSQQTALIRRHIEEFLAARREEKLKGKEDTEGKYRPENWIPDAAHRANWIRIATHVLKFTHPDAKGTSLYREGNPHAPAHLLGSHVLAGALPSDVVGNAAALDVFKFLSIVVEGKPLWQWAREEDPAFVDALPGTPEERLERCRAFAAVLEEDDPPASHNLAKQLYWPLESNGYHLLQPLFPSSLYHRLWERLRDDRFSEASRDAREARREGHAHPQGYRDWPDLAIMRFGSTKPQNISQLNSERHGEVWLLPVLPPQWRDQGHRPPCHRKSAFAAWERIPDLQNALDELGRYLHGVRDWNNKAIRLGRARRVEQIIDHVLQLAAEIQAQPGGWSAAPDCRLSRAHKLWLDPGRDEPDFQSERRRGEWIDEVAADFAAWFNGHLERAHHPVGTPEYRVWHAEFSGELQEALKDTLKEMES